MNLSSEFKMTNRMVLKVWVLGVSLLAGFGCQQRMAQQPYYRPYETTDQFATTQSNRPLEEGTVHRDQFAADSPLITGLTADEWKRFRDYQNAPAQATAPTETENRERNFGAPRFDPRDAGLPKVYTTEFPFAITAADLRRGQERFTIYCATCHGPLGNGQGKIWERGYLKPTSFHTNRIEGNEPGTDDDITLGYSRGYWRFGIQIPMREVPIGYYFEVISKGYGGMPDYAVQISPADRWRIVAYIRTLQLSQYADVSTLPADIRNAVTTAASGGKK